MVIAKNKFISILIAALAIAGMFAPGNVARADSGAWRENRGFELNLESKQKVFAVNENPELNFVFRKQRQGWERVTAWFKDLVSDEYEASEFAARVDGNSDTDVKVEYDKNGRFRTLIADSRNLRPGKHTLDIEITDPSSGGEPASFTQDFIWGVLAFNPDQSVYQPGDTAYLQFAVLDDNGDTLCDAKIKVNINGPGWGNNGILSTADGTIVRNPDCGPNNVIDTPDYYSRYKLDKPGIYEITVVAETANGPRTLSDRIEVGENPPFTVRREGPTRIWPKADYTMAIEIKVNEDFSGDIIEHVPDGFSIFNFKFSDNIQYPISNIQTLKENDEKKIIISDIDLIAGETYTFRYSFDAPDRSPEFYLLGPLEAISAQGGSALGGENRKWQIASDKTAEFYASTATAEQSWSSGTWNNIAGTVESGTAASTNGWLDNSNFTVGERYLIIAQGSHSTGNNNAQSGFRVTHGGTAFSESVGIEETDRTGAKYRGRYFWFTVWTAADEDIEIQSYRSGDTAATDGVDLIAINAEELIAHGDLKWAVATAAAGPLTTTPTAKVSTAWRPLRAGDNWLTGAYTQAQTVDVDVSFAARLNIDSGTIRSNFQVEGERAVDTPVYGLGWVNAYSVATHTAAVELYETAANQAWNAAGVFALRLDAFQSSAAFSNAASLTLPSDNSYVQIASSAYTPLSSGYTLVLGGFMADDNDARVTSYLLESGSPLTAETGGWQFNATDIRPAMVASLNNYAVLTQKVYSVDARTTRAIVAAAVNPWLVAFSMEMKEPPTGAFGTLSQKSDGSGKVDVQMLIDDADNDDCKAKLEYVLGAACSFGASPARSTLSEVDADTTASAGDPLVSNSWTYQVGTTSDAILTSSGANTVNVDWNTKTDLPSANGETYCLRLTANDYYFDQATPATATVVIDNTAPAISAVITDNLMYKIGDTLRATVTVASEPGNLTIGPGSTVNGGTITNIQKANNTTFTVDYTVAAGQADRWATGTIPYNISLADPNGNKSATSSGSFANGSLDANAPAISAAAIPNRMYGIGDILRATVTVAADPSVFSLHTATINGKTAVNLQRIDSTGYTLEYTVAEGDTDRASGTIPYSIRLRDYYGNINSAYSGSFTNGSLDAHRPVIQGVYITNGTYGIGDGIDLVIDTTESGLHLDNVAVNGKSVGGFVDHADTTYSVTYAVAEGDTDRSAGAIPVSIVMRDRYGNENVPYTTPSANSASVDAHKPEILSVALPNRAYKIGDTITATATVSADTDSYTLGASTINNVAAGSLHKVDNSTYTFNYTVQSGNSDRTAGMIPVSLVLADSLSQSNDLPFTTVDANTASIDANPPVVSTITFTPGSGTLKVGDKATATIALAGAEVNCTAVTMTINTINVISTFADLGSGNYRLVYTVAEGHTDHPDNDDLPVYLILRDASGNDSAAYATADPTHRPGVDAHTPGISSVTFTPTGGTLKVGDKATATIAVSGAEAGLNAGNTMTINGVDVSATFVDIGSGNYQVVYTVSEGNTDIDDADDLPVNLNIQDDANNISAAYATADPTHRPGVDAHTPGISSVTFTPTGGTLKVGDKATATIAVSGAEAGLNAGNTMTINGVDVSATFVDIGSGNYQVVYTVSEGNTDIDDADDLPVNLNIQDDANNISAAYATADPTHRPGVDAHTPGISSVTFTPTGGTLKVGDKATATIAVSGAEAGLNAGNTMTINGVDVSATFVDIGSGNYQVVYTVSEGNTDIDDADDLPVNLNIQDDANNISAAYATADPTHRPGVDAHTPGISSVTFTPTGGTLKVGDKATATIAVSGAEAGLNAGNTMTINGVDVSATFVDIGSGNYQVVYTVSEGNTDIDDADDLPVNLNIQDDANNISAAYATADPTHRPGVDAHTPGISSVTFTPTGGTLKVGDKATATIAVSGAEAGLNAGNTMTINGVDVSATFVDIGSGNYQVVYTVSEGNTDIDDADDLPVNLNIQDDANNISAAYATADPTHRPGVDAHTPTVPGGLSYADHTNNSIIIIFGATSTESNFSEYRIYYKAGQSGVTETDSVWDQGDDGNLGDILFNHAASTTISGLDPDTDYVFNIWVYDQAGNKASAAAELQAATNYRPTVPSDLVQKLNDNYTVVENNAWAIDQSMVLSATSTDTDDEFFDYYYEVVGASSTLTTAATVPASSCNSGTGYVECTEKIWKNSTGPAWYSENWLYRKQIVIDSDLVEDDLQDFPFLISNTDEDLRRNARSDGHDIIFTAADGVSEVNYERKLYDPANGQLIAWVKTDLSSSADTFLYMYYGNSGIATDHSTTTGVWDADYLGVWHMDEPPTGSANDIKDSSGYGHDMTSYNMDSSKRIVTDTGYAYDFDGAGDYLEDSDGENYINGLSQFTVELWLKSDVTGSDRGFIIGEPPAGNDSFFTLRYDEAGANNQNTYHNLVKGAITITGPTEKQYESSAGVQTTDWQHLVFRWQSGGQYEVLINGQYDSYTFNSPAGTGVTTGATMLRIGQGGKDNTAALGWDGVIDEVRISDLYRSDAWEKTAYNNQSNLTDFALMGAQDAVRIFNLPESSEGYKWQVMACDGHGACSDWTPYNPTTPNFKVDNTAPTTPGNLSEDSHTSTSVTLNLNATSTESFFAGYKIFYKQYDGTPVAETDSEFSAADDPDLADILYNGTATATINFLTAGTQYEFNIWAYDESGQKASATPITVTTASASNEPAGYFTGASEKANGGGAVDLAIRVNDLDNDPIRARIDYAAGTACDFSSPLDPTLDTKSANITADFGQPAIDNSSTYQVGASSDWIITAFGYNTVNFDWLSKTDIPGADGDYCLRLITNDGTYDQVAAATTTLTLDNVNPTAPGSLTIISTTTYQAVIGFGATSSDTNFNRYEIHYKAGTSGVTINNTEKTDGNLSAPDFNGAANTVLDGLLAGTDYVVNIWAYDDYGNRATATELAFHTNQIPAAPASLGQYKSDGVTAIANNGWTNEDTFHLSAAVIDEDPGETITLYFEIASTSASFTDATSSACAYDASWTACLSRVWQAVSAPGDYSATPFTGTVQPAGVPDAYTGLKWQVMACDHDNRCSAWSDAGSDPNLKIDHTAPTPPGSLALGVYDSDSITLTFGSSTEESNFREYIIYYKMGTAGIDESGTPHSSTTDANMLAADYNSAGSTVVGGLAEGQDYVFNIWAYDQAGNAASSSAEYTHQTNNRPIAVLDSYVPRLNGSGIVDIDFTVNDADGDNVRAMLEFDPGGDCEFPFPLDPTIDETDANATSTYGDAKVENDNFYQIGNAGGWITTASGANTVHIDWQSKIDLPSGDNTYCLRLTANDQIENQASAATGTVTIDNASPGKPGALTLSSRSATALVLSYGATSSESHFYRYRLFYKEGVSTVYETDSEKTDANLWDQGFNGAATTSIGSLKPNTQYSVKLFVYDSYGNKNSSNQATFTTNARPTGAINAAVEKTNGSGRVDISVEVYDVNGDTCRAKMEYVAGSSCNFASPLDPTLDESQANISADYGIPTIANSSEYQVGSPTRIITSSGSNTVNFDWLSKTDLPAGDGVYCLRLTVVDETDSQLTLATTTVTIDNANPVAPDNLSINSVTGISVMLDYGLFPGSDSHFKEYKIFYKKGSSGVAEADTPWTKNDDINLGAYGFNSASSTIIPGLEQDTDYVFNIWIYDLYGNKAHAAEISTTTAIVPSATWREAIDTADPTAGTFLAPGDNIRIRLAAANAGDWITSQSYRLEYGLKASSCAEIAGWTVVPAVAVGEHFEMAASDFFDNLASTTARLSADGRSFVPGYMLENPSASANPIALAANQYTELEYTVVATVDSDAGQTYCFRLSDQGIPLDEYAEYAEITLAPPPQGVFKSLKQRSNGSGIIDLSIGVSDLNGDPSRARLEYVAGADCDFGSPLRPTMDETNANITATYGDPTIDNSADYQIGTSSYPILTAYGTNTVAFDWDTLTDLPDSEGDYCLRLTANDYYDDQNPPATTTVFVDNHGPSEPGNLSVNAKTLASVTFTFNTAASDPNFSHYVIYYKIGASGVTESDTPFGTSSDPHLDEADYGGAATTTISGLQPNTQYVFRLWAYDKFGNKTPAAEEQTVKLVPSISGEVYGADGINPLLTSPHISIVVNGVIQDSVDASGLNGMFIFEDIDPPATGTPIVVYINGESEKGVTYMRYGGSGQITDLHIYQNKVVVRHDDQGPITVANINAYDADQDVDIPIRVSGSDLSLSAGFELIVWPGDTFKTAAGGSVSLDDVEIDGVLEAQGGQTISVSGDWDARTGAFVAASSTVEFTANETGHRIYTNGSPFYNLTFNGSGGEWTVMDPATTTATTTILAGHMIQGGNADYETASLVIAAGAVFGKATGTGKLVFEGRGYGYFEDQNAVKNNLGNVQIGHSPGTTRLNSDFSATSLTVNTNDSFYTRGYDVAVTDYITVNGRYDCLDDKEGDGTITTLGTDWTAGTGATFIAANSTTTFSGSGGSAINSGGTDANHDFYNLALAKNSAAAATLSGNAVKISGNLTIGANSTFDVSAANYAVNVGGSWLNNGAFNARQGTTTFDAVDTGNVVDAGSSSFYNVEFNSAGGGWTVVAGATSTNNWYINDAVDFSVNSGIFIEVQGIFQNFETEANTDWSDSILYLNNGMNLLINPKTVDSSDYGTIKVGAGTDIRMWNASATVSADPTGSLYSMDNDDNDGDLYIWGDYHAGAGQTEYWSDDTDFDGADISGSARQANVRLSDGTLVTMDGGDIYIQGSSSATTTIDNQGDGNYGLNILVGNFSARYFQVRNIDVNGLSFANTPNIVALEYGDMELAVNGGSLISLNATVVNANPLASSTGMRFATTTAIGGTNVNLIGSANSVWLFYGHYGNLSGEAYDSDPGDPRGYLIWEDSPNFHPSSGDWQWFHDEENETPGNAISGLDITPSQLGPDNTVKLRLTINEVDGIGGENVKYRLAFSEQADFGSGVYPVGEIGSTTAAWTYADGGGNDNEIVTARLLPDNTDSGTHNESNLSYSSFGHAADTAYEFEFTLYRNKALDNTTYYFRPEAVYFDNYLGTSTRPVVYDTGESYASVTAASGTLRLMISGLSVGTAVESITTDFDTTASEVPFGDLFVGTQKEGAQQIKVTTNAERGYQLFVSQKQDFQSNNGAGIDPIGATNDSPGAWLIDPNPSGFGYHTGDASLSGVDPARFAAPNRYARFESAFREIGYSPIPVENDTIDFVYKVEINSLQAAGDYQTEVMYIVVPTY